MRTQIILVAGVSVFLRLLGRRRSLPKPQMNEKERKLHSAGLNLGSQITQTAGAGVTICASISCGVSSRRRGKRIRKLCAACSSAWSPTRPDLSESALPGCERPLATGLKRWLLAKAKTLTRPGSRHEAHSCRPARGVYATPKLASSSPLQTWTGIFRPGVATEPSGSNI